MYLEEQRKLAAQVRAFLREKYNLDLPNIVIDQPPDVAMGEFALPLSFELAKRLRKPPRKIAEEIAAEMRLPEGFEKLEVAGAGYINARLKRDVAARALASGAVVGALSHAGEGAANVSGKILVEHTSINPNKAAHIGHLRNAILGDTFVRLLRSAGHAVDVQNYIDNTGVQVADVVVGFVELEKKSKGEIAEMIASMARFDYYCWELYARVSQWYEQDKEHLKARSNALHAIEQGGNELADIAEMISVAVLRRHLETMDRLEIEYDFLPRESEILHLHFWEAAFELLKQKGVLYFETEGKNKGCWVMTDGRRASTSSCYTQRKAVDYLRSLTRTLSRMKMRRSSCARMAPSGTWARTLLITCGSLGCWGATLGIDRFTSIPISTRSGFRRSMASLSIRTSAA